MKMFKLICLITALYSCKKINKDDKLKYDNSIGESEISYEYVTTNYYYSNNRLKEQVGKTHTLRNGKRVHTINASTQYFYDESSNLVKTIRVTNIENKSRQDSMVSIFEYSHDNKLIKKIILDPSDTIEIEENNYSKGKNFEEFKKIILRKDRFERHNNSQAYDTLITWVREEFDDSLKMKTDYFIYKNKNKILKESTLYTYTIDRIPSGSYTLDAKNDTLKKTTIKHKGNKIERIVHISSNGKYISTELYDKDGCIDIIIKVNREENRKDTTYFKCDSRGNVIEMREVDRNR